MQKRDYVSFEWKFKTKESNTNKYFRFVDIYFINDVYVYNE